MDENIFDKDSFDAIKPVDLKETMETSCRLERCGRSLGCDNNSRWS